jgi:hypothetical protein
MDLDKSKIMWLKPDEYVNDLVSCLKATGIDKVKKLFAILFSELTKENIN